MKQKFTALSIIVIVLIAGILGAASVFAAEDPLDPPTRFEVAEDGARFVFDNLRLYEDGMPNYGSAFVTQGYLYPEGTLNGSNGVLPDGSPEFPELVIGEWTCYGWLIGEGAYTTTGEWVVSTQIYQFSEAYGGANIVTNGFEIADFDVPYARAITGGTGVFNNVNGEQVQTLLGFTDAMGVNLLVELQPAL